jgi:hypothetical protein
MPVFQMASVDVGSPGRGRSAASLISRGRFLVGDPPETMQRQFGPIPSPDNPKTLAAIRPD